VALCETRDFLRAVLNFWTRSLIGLQAKKQAFEKFIGDLQQVTGPFYWSLASPPTSNTARIFGSVRFRPSEPGWGTRRLLGMSKIGLMIDRLQRAPYKDATQYLLRGGAGRRRRSPPTACSVQRTAGLR